MSPRGKRNGKGFDLIPLEPTLADTIWAGAGGKSYANC